MSNSQLRPIRETQKCVILPQNNPAQENRVEENFHNQYFFISNQGWYPPNVLFFYPYPTTNSWKSSAERNYFCKMIPPQFLIKILYSIPFPLPPHSKRIRPLLLFFYSIFSQMVAITKSFEKAYKKIIRTFYVNLTSPAFRSLDFYAFSISLFFPSTCTSLEYFQTIININLISIA